MAREVDPWRRLREKEDGEDTNTGLTLRERRIGADDQTSAPKIDGFNSEQLEKTLESTRVLIEQINNLYNMFVAGIEERAPIEKRKLLDKTMEQIMAAPKPTSASLFRYQTLLGHYHTYKDRWDRLLRDLESGKVARRRIGGTGAKPAAKPAKRAA
jgi:hypothetical protein